ncbi:MAG: hypothetical protein K2M45_04475 [Muribaculaceae bacterium]|nr:hypothetical protein [Muribaculaceae bacterium]
MTITLYDLGAEPLSVTAPRFRSPASRSRFRRGYAAIRKLSLISAKQFLPRLCRYPGAFPYQREALSATAMP